jgi:hypothetical protein
MQPPKKWMIIGAHNFPRLNPKLTFQRFAWHWALAVQGQRGAPCNCRLRILAASTAATAPAPHYVLHSNLQHPKSKAHMAASSTLQNPSAKLDGDIPFPQARTRVATLSVEEETKKRTTFKLCNTNTDCFPFTRLPNTSFHEAILLKP